MEARTLLNLQAGHFPYVTMLAGRSDPSVNLRMVVTSGLARHTTVGEALSDELESALISYFVQ